MNDHISEGAEVALGLQERHRIAKPYGKAFMKAYSLLCEKDPSVGPVLIGQITSLQELSEPNTPLKSFFDNSARYKTSDVLKALDALGAKVALHDIVVNLLKVAAVKGRLDVMSEIFCFIQDLALVSMGMGHGKISSAVPLTADALNHIKPLLHQLFPSSMTPIEYKDFVISQKIAPELLGGIVIQLGSLRVDSSLKGKMTQLTHLLKA